MSPSAVGIIGICVLILLLLLRMPVGFAMALVGFTGFCYLVSPQAAISLLAKDFWAQFSSYSLTVIPLFVLMGQFAFHSGGSHRLYKAAYAWLGHLPGGLAMATIGACGCFAAICGSSPATAATMGTVALPEMKRYNYDPALATGSVAAGGTLGILIPPSVVFIIYGIMTEQSIGKLFAGGIFPGILLMALFIIVIYVRCRHNSKLGPAGPKTGFADKMSALLGGGEVIVLFALVMGGLFLGIFTPTEAGAAGAFCALIVAIVKKQLTWKGFVASLGDATRTACMILIIVTGATVFGHFLAVTRIPFELANWVSELSLSNVAVMGVILLIYLAGGCFMDALALILLTVPIFYPVVIAMGFDPIWFGVVIVLVTEMGLITPPVGINVYVINGVAKDVSLQTIFKGILPFLAAMIICTAMLLFFPSIALYLPGLL